MQVHKKKWSVLTSFVSWKSKILFFQIRTLTGFWFCILNWFRSSLNIFSVMLVCVEILHPENNWITDQESCYLKKKSTRGKTKWHSDWHDDLVPCRSLPWGKIPGQNLFSTLDPWTLQDFCFFFPQVLLQRLTSCRLQCLFVQIFWVSAGSLAISLDNLCWSCTGFKTCSRQREKKLPFVQEDRHFYKKHPKTKLKKTKTKWIQWHDFISVKY